MARTVSFALAGSLIMAVIAVPALSSFLLKKGKHAEFRLLARLKAIYRPAVEKALRKRKTVVLSALGIFLVCMALVPLIGTEFLPTLEEGSIFIGVVMAPSIALEEATETIMTLESRILEFGPVEETVSRIGRPEAGSHPHPVNYGEIHIELKPEDEWGEYGSREEIVEGYKERPRGIPGGAAELHPADSERL